MKVLKFIQLRWITGILGIIFLAIMVILNITYPNFMNNAVSNTIWSISLMPLIASAYLFNLISCDDLGCMVLLFILFAIVLILVYFAVGFLIGYAIEKIADRKKK